MAEVDVSFFVRYELQFGDGEWGPTRFGPADESGARAFFEDLTRGTGPVVRNARIVRREERVIVAQDG
ncbi:hypothetical protein [Mycobacterium sp. D16Q16]|uniref:hypothetical protein n=1 Tax=Mycobacterium sp. D16Q16 TaxID=1855659 RepID=UPI0009930736|nr:hypothetical protein [Mycobacterium sp. D16Q16]